MLIDLFHSEAATETAVRYAILSYISSSLIILCAAGSHVKTGAARQTQVAGVSAFTMPHTSEDKWCDRFESSIMLIQVLAMYRLRSERVNVIPKEGVYGSKIVRLK
jgi:hypothetical protein